ncbi:hypothetical protein WJX81_008000 [Elliptochloris bilobata]|uniref:Calcium uniporter protein C-terminal domain-containing protein n=1 Tax=Elliptochloris bilobata TaxID=381761 RepID=A0AAW1S1R2_9CHLO
MRRRVSEANSVLQSIDAMHFRELLADLSEEQHHLPYKELLQKSVDSGAAGSAEEAGHLCEALRAAGVVVRVGGIVFLRPDEVAETILKALPDTEQEVEARLRELRLELTPLVEQKRRIDGRVQRRTRTYLWMGLGFLIMQWGMLARLTFWELSWDVIEPITYFLGSGTTILFYCYFMATREEFAYNKGVSWLERTFQEDKYKEHGFDLRRYERLQRDVRRYERYMRRATDQHVSLFPEPEETQSASDTIIKLAS